ncbi:hypothetical protein [Aestuariispira ectoiniformans]|uniref:hypothetical protein n=1 Tax=Aestuariispira ectoiniformans TaxID=2775080 RepID=UPI00223AC5D0|nr:hypothetical protein [Aestuariispira ectoiniformans]
MIARLKLNIERYPVEAFFNRLSHEQFTSALRNFSNGRGYNPEDLTCFFPADVVEDEGGEEGDYDYIEFWEYSGNQEVRLKFHEFIEILKQASLSEIDLNSGSENEIRDLISKTENYLKTI